MTEAIEPNEQPEDEATEMAEVLPFPSQQQGDEDTDETEVLDAEPVDEDQAADELQVRPSPDAPAVPEHPGARIPPALRRSAQVTGRIAVAGARGTARAGRAARPHATRAGKASARHGIYLVGGTWDMVSESYKRATHRDIDESIRAAQRDGDHGTAAQLLQHKIAHRKVLLERWQVFGKFLIRAPIGVGLIAGTTLLITFVCSVVGLFQQGTDGFTSTWSEFGNALVTGWDWVSWAATTVVPGAAVLGLVGLVLSGYNARRTRRAAPEWAAPQSSAAGTDTVSVTSDRLVTALRNCGIPELRNAIKDGETAGLVDLISKYGPGVRTTITLPRGIPASKLVEKASSIASSLHRGVHELTIAQVPGNASQATIWAAEPGALDEPVPASPLMAEGYGPVDLYRDLMPWGLSQMGDPVELSLLQRHIVLAGLSKQGKTASARALALWTSLDPSVELQISDLKGVGDWSMFEGIATTLIEGSGNEEELATCDMVEDLVEEMQRRKQARKAMGAKGDVTSKEAKDGSGFHPIVCVIDEVQIAYMSQATETVFDAEGEPRQGKRTVGGQQKTSRLWQAAKALHDQARAVNIHLWEFAQNPTDKNLPAIVREGGHLRASLYVSSENIARMAVGDPVVDSGGAPHRLRNEVDAGTVVLAGATEAMARGQMSTTVRTHYISTADAWTVADRAKELRNGPVADEPEVRDLLADVSDVLGTEDKVKATDVVSRLRSLARSYKPYADLDGGKLADQLWNNHGVKVTRSSVLMVRADRVRLALSSREEDEEGTETA